MHPSTSQGAANAGGASDRRGANIQQPVMTQAGVSFPTGFVGAQPDPSPQQAGPLFAPRSNDGSWLFAEGTLSTSSTQAAPPSAMIGPSSTFYSANGVPQQMQTNLQQYECWVKAYSNQPQPMLDAAVGYNFNLVTNETQGQPQYSLLQQQQLLTNPRLNQYGAVGDVGVGDQHYRQPPLQQRQSQARESVDYLYDLVLETSKQPQLVQQFNGPTQKPQASPQQSQITQPYPQRPVRHMPMRQGQPSTQLADKNAVSRQIQAEAHYYPATGSRMNLQQQQPTQIQSRPQQPKVQHQLTSYNSQPQQQQQQQQQPQQQQQQQQPQQQQQQQEPQGPNQSQSSYPTSNNSINPSKSLSINTTQSGLPSPSADEVLSTTISSDSSAQQPPRNVSSVPVPALPGAGGSVRQNNQRQQARFRKQKRKQQQQAVALPAASTTGPAGLSNATPRRSSSQQKLSKRKRPRTEQVVAGDPEGYYATTDSEDEDYGAIIVGLDGVIPKGTNGPVSSRRGACKHCKRVKMKCFFPEGQGTCQRCTTSGHICVIEGRKLRTTPNKREYLLAQIRQKDVIIESLLKQLHNPYIATPLAITSYKLAISPSDSNNENVMEWQERLQASVTTSSGKGGAAAFKFDSRSEQQTIAVDSDSDEPKTVSGDVIGVVPPSDDEGYQQEMDPLRSSLPDLSVPIGLLANLSLNKNKGRGKGKKNQNKGSTVNEDLDNDAVGVANETYFEPGPATDLEIRASLIKEHSPPEILVHGLVTPEDVENLFKIFYDRINPFISLLDPVLHTPASTFARCPFLFTVICAISSRYYPQKTEIYPIAMHFAKHSAANALIDGWKSVELCQAYILMSVYAVPARRWEEDRSWLYTGLAIRIATDLNLHQVAGMKPTSEAHEREILNRTRVWLICYNLDRSTATQFGKPSTIKEDYILCNAKDWYKRSKLKQPYDVHLCGYSALLQIVARFHDEIFSDPSTPTGLNKRIDFRTVTMTHDAHLTAYHEEWSQRFEQDSDPNEKSCVFRCSLLPFLVNYSRLVMFSFGFQHAFQRGLEREDYIFFEKCLDSAKAVIRHMIEGLVPSGYMRYAPDGHFIFAAFASAFLLKLLRPEFSHLLSKEQENEIFELIRRLIYTFSSKEIAIDNRHTPNLYARFLAGLLSKYRREGVAPGGLTTQQMPPGRQTPQTVTGASQQSGGAGGAYPQDMEDMATTFSANPRRSPGVAGQQQYVAEPESTANRQGPGVVVPLSSELILGDFGAGGNGGGGNRLPIYTPEIAFAGTGPIHYESEMDFGIMGMTGITDEEMLASMQIIKDPAWEENVMMPGFQWDHQSPNSYYSTPSPSGGGAMVQQPLGPSYGMFHATQGTQAHLH